MQIDLAFFLVDLRDPSFFGATDHMISSWRKVMPNSKVCQVIDSKTVPSKNVDLIGVSHKQVKPKNLIKFKSQSLSDFGKRSENPFVFSDVDIIWNRSCEKIFEKDFDIALLGDKDSILTPYDSSIVFSKATEAARSFWSTFKLTMLLEFIIVPSFQKKWGDRFLFSTLLGQAKPGCTILFGNTKILILEKDEVLITPEEKPKKTTTSLAVHFSGLKKAWMADYVSLRN